MPEYTIEHLNFSTYGASFVNLDQNGNPVTPFYNYMKPYPREIVDMFTEQHQSISEFQAETSSPWMGFLNSGLQLYYLKCLRHDQYCKIKRAVHLPQYLSSCFTGKYFGEYSSLGCHTGLWNFKQRAYAEWVVQEGIDKLLDPLVDSGTTIDIKFNDKNIKVGVGIHDSSAALMPYIESETDPFVLISTGTWCICLNPFNHKSLSKSELDLDCLEFLGTRGQSVKASRLLLGRHYAETIDRICSHYSVDTEAIDNFNFLEEFVPIRENRKQFHFDHTLVKPERFGFSSSTDEDLSVFGDFRTAVIHFIDEITDMQVESLRLVIGDTSVRKVFVDGGFSSNALFLRFLANKLQNYDVYSSDFANGSAVGAAMVVSNKAASYDQSISKVEFTEKQSRPLHTPRI